jgi:hypothetical protein
MVYFVHGMARTGLYRLFYSMIARCERPTATSYERYGGRGIKVCPRWRHNFLAFVEDMGPRPSLEHTLDRIDPDGNYEPSNCRWAPWKTQQRNRGGFNRRLEVNGETLTLAEWSERTGIGYTTIRERLRRGWSASRAVTESTRQPTTAAHAPG